MNPEDNTTKRTLTEKEAALYTGMSASFLRHGRIDGDRKNRTPAPKFIKIGKSIRYPKDELDKWLAHFPRLSHLYEGKKLTNNKGDSHVSAR